VAAVMTLAQRGYSRHLVRVFESGVTLNTTLGDLTATQRARLQDVAASFGIDYAAATLQTTVRQALRLLAKQMPTRSMLGEAFQRAA